MRNLKKKLDHRHIGLLFALILPLIGLVILWQWKLGDHSLGRFFHFLRTTSKGRDNILIMSMIPSMLLFYFVNFRWRWERFSLGLVSLTVVYAVIFTIIILLF